MSARESHHRDVSRAPPPRDSTSAAARGLDNNLVHEVVLVEVDADAKLLEEEHHGVVVAEHHLQRSRLRERSLDGRRTPAPAAALLHHLYPIRLPLLSSVHNPFQFAAGRPVGDDRHVLTGT